MATSYLLQLGNSQRNVLFNAGTGSASNLYASRVDLSTIDTVFLSHLHSDHITDLAPLYALANNRTRPLRVYGPSGSDSESGTAAMIAGLRQFLHWDNKARAHVKGYPPDYQGNQIVAHEFNYSKENQLIFEEDGFRVWSNPAFHYDTPGPVALRLAWNNLTVTYSGDSIPLDTFVNFAKGSDVVIHEAVGPIYDFAAEPAAAQNVITNHTTSAETGAIFQVLQPRLAIATHLRVTPYTITPILTSIRSQYPVGPLAVSTDFTVWDISAQAVVQCRFVPVEVKAGYEFGGHPHEYSLGVSDVATLPRPDVVAGGLRVFKLPDQSSLQGKEGCGKALS
ncbi:hypothetical protein WJX73_007627 [Symbiochloris irregularis]|uniref:Metallo-beta-lactamase domain-containing protein n=1 Tax=Symbiochloris irregularis TaxID=706552 RepID=A0AAW1NXD9_9CHLO